MALNEVGPDHSVEAAAAAPQLSDSERHMEETIDAMVEMDGNSDALKQCLDNAISTAISTANDGSYGEAVGLITYGGNRLGQMLSDCGLDASQVIAIRTQYDAAINPDQFGDELEAANSLQRERILSTLTSDADRKVDRDYESYKQVLDDRISLYEEDIDASKEAKKALEGDLDVAQEGLGAQMASFDEGHNYGLTAEQAINASDQQLFAAIYGEMYADKPEPTTDVEHEIQKRVISGRRHQLKLKIEPLKVAQAAVDEVEAKIALEDRNIEANKGWIASSKAERGPLKQKYKEDKKAIADGSYTPEGKTESLFAAARRLSTGGDRTGGGHGREEFKVISDYADLAGDSSQELLQKAARRKLDGYEAQLTQRVDNLGQVLREFGGEDPEMDQAYEGERERLQGLLSKIDPVKYGPPDLPMA